MNSSIALCSNLKSRRNLTRAVASFSSDRRESDGNEASQESLRFWLFLFFWEPEQIVLFTLPSSVLCKDGKMRSLQQFYDRTSDFPSSDQLFFFSFSAFPKHLRKHTKHFTRTTETRPAEKKNSFSVQLQQTLITSDEFRRTSKVHDTKVAQVMLAWICSVPSSTLINLSSFIRCRSVSWVIR